MVVFMAGLLFTVYVAETARDALDDAKQIRLARSK
jgi:hypothetical protein